MKKILIVLLVLAACKDKKDERHEMEEKQYPTTGMIERVDPALDSIISPGAKAEIIAEGFQWSEGPLWIEHDSVLLFSDVPANTIYIWNERNGKSVYLKPSGFTGTDTSKKQGSNGLVLDNDGHLVICQHGDRRIARMDAALEAAASKFITIADKYNGKRFSSPNDVVYNFDDLYFTDPPFGLPTQSDNDSSKEINFNGVYRVTKDGKISVIVDSLSRPNGLAFFPGGRRLLVSNCDAAKPNWYVFDVNPDDTVFPARIFYSAAGYDKNQKGLPDGLKIDTKGNVFATGPGGLYILNSDGKLLGKLKLDNPASNCALSGDEKTLYITNAMYVLRFRMRK